MRICFVASARSIHSYRWIKYFAERGHEVHWIAFNASGFPELENVRFHPIEGLGFDWLFPPDVLLKCLGVRRAIRKIRPEILHAHYAGANGLAGALSGFHPFVVTAWGSDVLVAGRSAVKKPFVRATLKAADLITCDAEHMRRAVAAMGVNPAKIKIVYFGTDVDRFKREQPSEPLRVELGIAGCPTVISTRRLYPIYQVDLLVQAVPHVLVRVPDAKFIIAGEGTEAVLLQRLADALGVAESIRFVGALAAEQLSRYLALADVYVSTSLSDAGLAASTAEAMACELPVIVTDSGENREWVKDGENGFLVPTDDAKVLADRIVALLESEEMRTTFGRAGRRVIETRNNVDHEMRRMETLYLELAGHRAGRLAGE